MKKILVLLSTAIVLTLAACGGHCDGKCDSAKCTDPNCPHKKEAAASKDSTKTIASAAYDCPMHCKGAASDKPGTCPVCKMPLEKVGK